MSAKFSKRIAINGLSASIGGGRTYLTNLLPALHSLESRHRWFIYVPSSLPPWLQKLRDTCTSFEWRTLRAAPRASWWRGVYEQLLLPAVLRQDNIQLLYSLADVVPFRFKGIHVLAIRNPTLYTRTALGWPLTEKARITVLRQLATRSVGRADQIIFVSEDSRHWISEILQVPMERSSTVYHGVADAFFDRGDGDAPTVRKGPWDQQPYVLSVSTIYRYKNYVRLVEAFEAAVAENQLPHHLVIVGRPVDRHYAKQLVQRIGQSLYANRIHLLGEVPYEALPALYRGAAAKVFPSYLETFGHPLLEAMASRVPVAASNIGVFRELGGKAVLYFDPDHVEEMAAAIVRLLADNVVRAQLVERGSARACEFTWGRSARALQRLIEGLL